MTMRLTDHPSHRGGLGYLAERSKPRDTTGFFAISGARAIDRSASAGADGKPGRCDAGAFGPYGFHVWDGTQCNCGSTDEPDPVMGHHLLTMANIDFVTVVASALPHGYLLYFETKTKPVQNQSLTMRHSDCAWTLQEVFRLMWEWEQAHELFGNREPVAVACHAMWSAFAVPAEVEAWLIDSVPAQKVERFLDGLPNAQARGAGTPQLSAVFDEWVTQLVEGAQCLGQTRV